MSKMLEGKCPEGEKRFSIINPTSYNGDGHWCIITCELNELEKFGFDDDEIKDIDSLEIGCRWANSMYGLNAQVIRLG